MPINKNLDWTILKFEGSEKVSRGGCGIILETRKKGCLELPPG